MEAAVGSRTGSSQHGTKNALCANVVSCRWVSFFCKLLRQWLAVSNFQLQLAIIWYTFKASMAGLHLLPTHLCTLFLSVDGQTSTSPVAVANGNSLNTIHSESNSIQALTSYYYSAHGPSGGTFSLANSAVTAPHLSGTGSPSGSSILRSSAISGLVWIDGPSSSQSFSVNGALPPVKCT